MGQEVDAIGLRIGGGDSKSWISSLFSHPLLSSRRAKTKTLDFLLPGARVRPSFLVYFISEPRGEEADPMHGKQQFQNSLSRTISGVVTAALTIAFVLTLVRCPDPRSAGANVQGTSHLHRRTGRGNPLGRRDIG